MKAHSFARTSLNLPTPAARACTLALHLRSLVSPLTQRRSLNSIYFHVFGNYQRFLKRRFIHLGFSRNDKPKQLPRPPSLVSPVSTFPLLTFDRGFIYLSFKERQGLLNSIARLRCSRVHLLSPSSLSTKKSIVLVPRPRPSSLVLVSRPRPPVPVPQKKRPEGVSLRALKLLVFKTVSF